MKYASSGHPKPGHNDVSKLASFNCVGLLGWVLICTWLKRSLVCSNQKQQVRSTETQDPNCLGLPRCPFGVKSLHTSPILSFFFEDFIN